MRSSQRSLINLTALIAFSGAAISASADVKLPAILSDHMVLQQSSAVPIWGWADAGEKITVRASWSGEEQTTNAKADGSWRVFIKTPSAGDADRRLDAGTPLSLVIKGKNTVVLNDLLIGEVWLCSGQSNMEWPLSASDNAKDAIALANYPTIRLFTVQNAVAASPQKDCKGAWAPCTPQTAQNFSAVAYYFAKDLQAELKIPIGLIASDWGGTPCEAWASEATIRGISDLGAHLDLNERIRQREADGSKKIDPDFSAWLTKLADIDVGSHDPRTDSAGGWYNVDFNDSKWASAPVPGQWTGDLATFDGFVWMRTTRQIKEADAGKPATLTLGPIDDCDTIWINGIKVGESMTGDVVNTPRSYAIPAGVTRAGANTFAVRILDTGGPGGVTGDPLACSLIVGTAAAYPLNGEWKVMKGTPAAQLPQRPMPLVPQPYLAANLYNAMIAPLAGVGMRGAIWYQGESNRDRAFQYRSLFPAMITDWRTRWAEANSAPNDVKPFPFYFVQIAPFNYGGDVGQAAELREAQTMTLGLPNTGMAVTMDIGNPDDIHPRNKSEVGRRLALWALAKTYGRSEIVFSGPLYKSMKIENNRVHLTFDNIGGGLVSTAGEGQPLGHFLIAGEDRRFVPAQVSIEDGKVIVWNNDLLKPLAVRYAWGAADQPQLKNREGLPAPSFRTDDWPTVTGPQPTQR